jgi:Xaa-Pro aminopeptidase
MSSGEHYFTQRIDALRSTFNMRKLDAFITSSPASLRYLCGYSGSNGLLIITAETSWFFTDFRYQESMQTEVHAEKKFTGKGSLLQSAVKRNLFAGLRSLGFEKEHLTVTGLENIRSMLTGKRIVLTSGVVEQLRSVKDESEIATLKKAFDISDRVFQKVLGIIRPGLTELEISAEISYLHKKYGAENDSFDVIAASGVRGSLPHGTATEKRIAKNEFITLDFGCLVHGYHSDMTRTICVGRPTAEMKKVYAIVLEAQQRGCDAVKEGVAARKIDSVSRRYIASYGYGKYFGHSLGHGVGLDIHELPRIAPKSREILNSGNVITIEPGIYLPQQFGIRIEDTVVVRKEGCEVLTGSPKELIII